VPAHHLAKTVGIYGGTTPGAGLHYAAGHRRPMVLALCSAELVSRRLRPLIESGAVVPPSVSSNPSRKGRFVIVLLAYIEPRRRPYQSCTTNAARCSPQQFAHAPPPLSPRFRFAWTKHLPTQSEEWGPSRRGFGTVQQTQFDDVTQMVKISDRRFVVPAPQDAIHGS
jgi:hypothetical protein